MKKIYDIEMPLLNRRRVALEVEHVTSATPSKNDMRKKIADFLKVPEELVAIRHVYSRFGEGKSKIIAHVYEKKENHDYFEKKKEKKVKENKEDGKKEEKK